MSTEDLNARYVSAHARCDECGKEDKPCIAVCTQGGNFGQICCGCVSLLYDPPESKQEILEAVRNTVLSELEPHVQRLRALETALLAIAAEDWNDETQPLLDGKPQGIGPCARARRALGIETYGDAFDRRMKSLPAEYRSKRFKEGA